ncbi:glycosyl transferase family 4 [archaeon]|jgi:UDP-N-acetylglucosamine--dolichyl-phosphate N-acetylglucosaminephosphotransferase|nr:glycosyl transferase family 4 [archaeon]MBT4373129.1 glycosyl transferase family 4 [archaeon]MBT4531474.1 glycosyl transferase family 4 [archaeon]MBT7001348.1 glycosyl transferase family 4 [archaeon]MBT7282166.1 glycosyl transferase family 4 [archaeon]
MVEKILILPILGGFFISLFSLPFWIKRAKRANLVGRDIHKLDKREVAEAGGISVLIGFVLGVLSYIAIRTFILNYTETTIEIFALLCTILIVGFIGFIDDVVGWKIGLGKKTRILLLIFAAVPLMVINAGQSMMIGVELGLFYPLLFIPLGIVGAAATFNFIAGYNGLETSQGIIILSALALVTGLKGNSWLSLICFIMVACLIAFYLFNKWPARVFPGDVLTYSVGALIAIIAILGNVEKIAVFFFIPYILETILKVRGGLKKESFGKLEEDGSLSLRYSKFYGLEHIAIYLLKKYNEKATEINVVRLINLFQLGIIILGLFLFKGGLF